MSPLSEWLKKRRAEKRGFSSTLAYEAYQQGFDATDEGVRRYKQWKQQKETNLKKTRRKEETKLERFKLQEEYKIKRIRAGAKARHKAKPRIERLGLATGELFRGLEAVSYAISGETPKKTKPKTKKTRKTGSTTIKVNGTTITIPRTAKTKKKKKRKKKKRTQDPWPSLW